MRGGESRPVAAHVDLRCLIRSSNRCMPSEGKLSRETIIKTVLKFYPDADAIYLFGTYLTPDQRQDSDVDIAILLPHGKAKALRSLAMSDCRGALEDALKRTVDLINLRMVNTVFQVEIIHSGRLIYQRSEYAVDEFEMLAISFYQKLNEERAGMLQDILTSGMILRQIPYKRQTTSSGENR